MAQPTATHPSHEANRQTLAVKVAAHLGQRPHPWTSEELASLDDTGWAVIAGDLGRTEAFSPATRSAVVAYVAGTEAARTSAPSDPFAGLVPA